MCTAQKDLLKNAIEDMRKNGKIDTTVESSMESFIDDITSTDFYEVAYSEFDQTSSVNIVFADASRTATYSTAGTDELITSAISLATSKIKGLKLKGSDENVDWQLSLDGTNFFNVDSYNIDEAVTTTVYIKALVPATNVISGIIIIYENVV